MPQIWGHVRGEPAREPTDDRRAGAFRGDPAETGAFIYTFTFRLPFRMGISDDFGQEIVASRVRQGGRRADLREAAIRPAPFVPRHARRSQVLPCECAGRRAPLLPGRVRLGPADDKVDPHLYEQWVSLETPAALLTDESPDDGAYAFHRCLSALNVYLQAFALARNDDQVRSISSRELRPIVIVGAMSLTGTWTERGPILMHPDAKGRQLRSRPAAEHAESLNRAIQTMLLGNPFLRSWQWKARAERRRYEGDSADAVVSFQIAAEVFLSKSGPFCSRPKAAPRPR